MQQPDALDVLERVGAFRAGHFVLVSGRHTNSYINKDAVYPYTRETSQLCRAMAEPFKDANIEVVLGPAVGAAILSQWVAYHLSEMSGREVLSTYADKDGPSNLILRRGFDKLMKDKRVLIVEDLMTTGGSVLKVVNAARANDGEVVGVSVISNRGNVAIDKIGNPPRLVTLVDVQLDSWEAEECDLCKRGIPVNTDIGHGKEFVEQQK